MKPVIESQPHFKRDQNYLATFQTLLAQIFEAKDEDDLRKRLKIDPNENIPEYFYVYFGHGHCAIHDLNDFGEVKENRLLFIEF